MDFSLQPPILNLPPADLPLSSGAVPPSADRTTQACQSFASLLLTQVLSSLAKTTQAAEDQQQAWVWSLMSQSLAQTWSAQQPLEIVEALKNQVEAAK